MAGTRKNHVGDERNIDMLLAVSRGLQTYRYNGGKRDKKQSLTYKLYFQCIQVDAAPDTRAKTLQVVSTS